MADLRQELLSIEDEAAEYFAHVDTSYTQPDGYYHGNGLSSKDLWACMTPEDRSRSEAILAKFGAVIEEVSRVFQRSPALGETALHDLRQAVRQMQAAFQFKKWEDSAEFWRAVSPSDAKLIIEKALVTIRGLLSFGSPDVVNGKTGTLEGESRVSTTQAKNSHGNGRGLRSDPEVVKRNHIILQNPGLSAAKLCGQFDLENIQFPGDWAGEFGVQTWVEAYKVQQLKGRIDSIISKARPKAPAR